MDSLNAIPHKFDTRAEREAYILKRQESDSLAKLEKFPSFVNIETTNTCNARCVMCGIDFENRTKTHMKDAIFDKIVKELAPWRDHIRKINMFSDNEPLLDKDLERKIGILKDAGMKVIAISTNASALTKARAEALIEAGLDQIYIAIDSMVPEVYEKIRVRLSFDRVYKNTVNFIQIRDAAKAKTSVRVQMILQEINQDEKDTFASHWEPLLSEGDYIVVHRAHNWGGVIDTPAYKGDKYINTLPCISLWSNAMIHADGKIALCSVDTEQTSTFTLGDISKDSIENIWTGEKMKAMRERHLNNLRKDHPLCDGCTTWRESKSEVFIKVAAN